MIYEYTYLLVTQANIIKKKNEELWILKKLHYIYYFKLYTICIN